MLDASDNRLSGQLPGSYARLRFLSTLSLRGNAINATLPAAWAAGLPGLLQLCVCLALLCVRVRCSLCVSLAAAAPPQRQHTTSTHIHRPP